LSILLRKGWGMSDYMTDILHTICIQCDLPPTERTIHWVYEAVRDASVDPEATYNLKHNKDLDSMVKFSVFMLEVEKYVACHKAMYLRIGNYHNERSYYENKIMQQKSRVAYT
jgi:hypothetical protein